MKQCITVLLFLMSLTGFTQTQLELNNQAKESYNKADKQLNEVYKKLVAKNSSDTIFIKNLKIAQRTWITFRDAEVKLKYPEREVGYYGSMLPMCISNYLEQLTKERIATLQKYLDDNVDDCN